MLTVMLAAAVILSGCSGSADKADETDEQQAQTQESEMSIPIETVKTDSFEMDYFRFGKGDKVMVIIPGLSVQSVMGSAQLVADSYSMFSEDYTVYLFDRRKDLPENYSVHDMAEDTAAAFKELGLGKADLFGASQGGMIAMDIAIGHPELVNKLILGSTAARVSDDGYKVIDKWAQLAKEGKTQDLYMDFAQAVYAPETFEQLRETLTQMAGTVTDEELAHFVVIAEGTKGFDVLDDLDRIECPVLLLGAEDDNVLGPEASREIAEKLEGHPGFEMYMYDGYGHAAYDMAPDYRERMQKFFESEQ